MHKIQNGRGQKGFTLVELIVVIVILGVLVGITIGGIFKYVDLARRNRDIAVIEQANVGAQANSASIDINEFYKEVSTWATKSPFDKKPYSFVVYDIPYYCSEYFDNWDDFGDVALKGVSGDPAKHPIAFQILKNTFPDGIPKLNIYTCEVIIGITKSNNLFVRCYAMDAKNGYYIIDGQSVDYDSYIKYVISLFKQLA